MLIFHVDEGQLVGGSHSLTPITMVANLIDGFLAAVAPDTNLKLMKFQSLAAVIPEYARPLDDGIYRAIDIYLKVKKKKKLKAVEVLVFSTFFPLTIIQLLSKHFLCHVITS